MATATDPVCQMVVDISNPPGGQSEYKGRQYYFCGPGCKVAFDRDPEHVLSGLGVVLMNHSEQERSDPPKQGGILSWLKGIFGGKSLSDC